MLGRIRKKTCNRRRTATNSQEICHSRRFTKRGRPNCTIPRKPIVPSRSTTGAKYPSVSTAKRSRLAFTKLPILRKKKPCRSSRCTPINYPSTSRVSNFYLPQRLSPLFSSANDFAMKELKTITQTIKLPDRIYSSTRGYGRTNFQRVISINIILISVRMNRGGAGGGGQKL